MTDISYTWRDSELQAKPLRALNAIGARLSRFGVDLPALKPSSIVAAAVKAAGSSDLGSDSYKEPLEVFLASCNVDADLTTFGRILTSKFISAALANRIALHKWFVDHPEVHQERIESPWVIVGLPRTGTSVLSMLLGLDPMARPLLQWEAAHPIPPQHRLALQTLQSRQPTERWILKTPNHLWHLEALLAVYPDARIIWTHRDPAPVVTSLASLANAGQRPLTWRSDPRPTANEWKRKCRFALESAVAFDEKSEEGWCQHLHYDDLMADPLETVRQLYRRFGSEVSDLHARRIETFLTHRPKDAFGTHRYDPADFDWTYTGLAEEFSDYTARYHVRSETLASA